MHDAGEITVFQLGRQPQSCQGRETTECSRVNTAGDVSAPMTAVGYTQVS